MTLLNQNWISMAGGPVTGRTPPQTRVMNGNAPTDLQLGAIAHAYKLFTDALRVSVTPALVQNRMLADGTRLRMESLQGRDTVMVWPVAGDIMYGGSPPFFCIPFDETYRITPKQDTYFMKGFSVSTDGKPPVLGKLVKAANCSFLPKAKDAQGAYQVSPVSHPGNQTWFANLTVGGQKHESSEYVLSWWGQPNRYSQSPLDVALATGKQQIRQEARDSAVLSTRWIFANGWTDAMDGVLYRTLPAGSPAVAYPAGTVPPFAQSSTPFVNPPNTTVTIPYVYTQSEYSAAAAFSNALSGADYTATDSSRKAIWLNAVRFTTDFVVHSACIGRRGAARVVRIFTQQSVSGFKAREYPLSFFLGLLATGGHLADVDATSYVLSFPAIDGVTLASQSLLWIDYMVHPFYWNADGSEAMGLFAFSRTEDGASLVNFAGTALIKLAVAEGGFQATLIETSSFVESNTSVYVRLPYTPSGNHNISGNADRTYNCTYSYALAADYAGNTPKIIRGHVAEAMSLVTTASRFFNEVYTGQQPTWSVGIFDGQFGETDQFIEYNERLDYSHSSVQNFGGTATSKVSLSGVDVPALVDTCTRSDLFDSSGTGYHSVYQYYRRSQIGTNAFGNPIFRGDSGHVLDTRSSKAGYLGPESVYSRTMSQSGHASLWAVAGGDLRGGSVVLRESPWYFASVGLMGGSGPLGAVDRCAWVEASYAERATVRGGRSLNAAGVGGGATTLTQSAYGENLGSGVGKARYGSGVGRFARLNVGTAGATALCHLVYPMHHSPFGDITTMSAGGADSATSSSSSYNVAGGWPNISYPTFVIAFTNLDGAVVLSSSSTYPIVDPTLITPPPLSHPLLRTFSKIDGKQNGVGTAYVGAGGPSDVAFSSGATSPDGKVQYIGIVAVALAAPNTKNATAAPFKMDQWFSGGAAITPKEPYPYNGEYKMLACPVFTGKNLLAT